MSKPVQIKIIGHKLELPGYSFAFSTPAAAAQAQCMLREPKHVPRGGNKFDKYDVGTFENVKVAFDRLTSDE